MATAPARASRARSSHRPRAAAARPRPAPWKPRTARLARCRPGSARQARRHGRGRAGVAPRPRALPSGGAPRPCRQRRRRGPGAGPAPERHSRDGRRARPPGGLGAAEHAAGRQHGAPDRCPTPLSRALARGTRGPTEATAPPAQATPEHASDQWGGPCPGLRAWAWQAGALATIRAHLPTGTLPAPPPGQPPTADRRGRATLRQQVQGAWSHARLPACLPRLQRLVVLSPRQREQQETQRRAWLLGPALLYPAKNQEAA